MLNNLNTMFENFEQTIEQSAPQREFEYGTFINSLNEAGLHTTNLRANETSFEQYAMALSLELREEVLNSFDCEQDYVLQNQIAAIYKNQHVVKSKTFTNTLRSMGLTVNISSAKTSYISDYRGGNFSGTVTENGHITKYTISDNKGGEIIIMDANGNGSLECEEIFLNKILEGIGDDIIVGSIGPAVELVGGASGMYGNENLSMYSAENQDDGELSDKEFNKLVDFYVSQMGYSVKDAIKFIKQTYDVDFNQNYTGRYKDIEAKEPELLSA